MSYFRNTIVVLLAISLTASGLTVLGPHRAALDGAAGLEEVIRSVRELVRTAESDLSLAAGLKDAVTALTAAAGLKTVIRSADAAAASSTQTTADAVYLKSDLATLVAAAIQPVAATGATLFTSIVLSPDTPPPRVA